MSRINKVNFGNILVVVILFYEGFVRLDVFDLRVYFVLSMEVDEIFGCICMRFVLIVVVSVGRIEIYNLFFFFCFSVFFFNSLSFWYFKN